jgi:hypothetical protein
MAALLGTAMEQYFETAVCCRRGRSRAGTVRVLPRSIPTAGRKVPDMDTNADVTVVCDRCHRPVYKLRMTVGGIHTVGAELPDGPAAGKLTNRYQPDPTIRPGAFVLEANGPAGITHRHKLVCIGRRHPRYERVIAWERAERAFLAAVAAGHDRISMHEI